jgi:hypothetical protein
MTDGVDRTSKVTRESFGTSRAREYSKFLQENDALGSYHLNFVCEIAESRYLIIQKLLRREQELLIQLEENKWIR